MCHEQRGICKGSEAYRALVGLRPRVAVHVRLEVAALGKRLGAELAAVGPLPRMETKVGLEVGPLREGLEAILALEWAFARVDPHVLDQDPLVLGRVGAEAALEPPAALRWWARSQFHPCSRKNRQDRNSYKWGSVFSMNRWSKIQLEQTPVQQTIQLH